MIIMKTNLAFIATALLVLCAAIIGATTATTVDDSTDKLIHVTGSGKVTTTPDLVEISLAVQTENTDVKKAQQENAAKMNACINALKTLGLTSDEIKTTGYNIYSYTSGDYSSSPLGKDMRVYRVTNTLLVQSTKIESVGNIIDNAIANGANKVNYIFFTLTDESQQELRSQALTAAVKQARNDADAVAIALGKVVVDVKEVNIGSSYIPRAYSNDAAFMEKGAYVSTAIQTPIELDNVDVTATVTIAYIIN